MKTEEIEISVIIVNFNVREFLEQTLLSVQRALKDISSEVIVVDNASVDDSVQMVRRRFPEVILIENKENVGFSAANNQGLEIARGRFIVLLNPDTIVQEDTFSKLLDFFERTPEASAATCKIINPDGTFSIDCRHSIPTPLTAFWKVTGLSRLFPKSKIFGRYNLTYLDENDTYQVEAISGSFMMMRREIVQKVGKLDEDFFMYCEDIDYCYRINQAGGKIFYVPDSQIIHYKGESTKKYNLDYVITFNKSLYKFYKKHYQKRYVYPFKWLIVLGTILRGIMIFIKNNLELYYPLLIDLGLLNVILFVNFWIRYELRGGFHFNDFFNQYIIINLITTVAFFLSALFFETVKRDRFSVSKIIKATLTTFTFVSALTFFFKQFAFSRFVVVVSAVGSMMVMVLWRILLRAFRRKTTSALSRDYFLKRTIIVGFDSETRKLLEKLQKYVTSSIKILGLAALDRKDVGKSLKKIPVVTTLTDLPEYIRLNRIDLVIFTTHHLSFQEILTTMSRVQRPDIEFKMVPDHLEFMIGKSNVERLDALPLVDIEFGYGKPFNKIIKRLFDLGLALLLLIVLLPFHLWNVLTGAGRIAQKTLIGQGGKEIPVLTADEKGLRFTLNLLNILAGKISFVGAPMTSNQQEAPAFDYKPGLTGIVQINHDKITDDEIRETYEAHYIKNQGLFMDLELLMKAVWGGKNG
ncbi:glycosyltransferase [Calditrichota bacterium LG25]